MTCSICSQFDTDGNFVIGCSNFKIEALKKHDGCDAHKSNVLKHNAKTSTKPSLAAKSISLINKAAHSKLTTLFRNAHYIAKSGRPFTDYVALCKLDVAKGSDIEKTYVTDNYYQKFVAAIAENRRNEQSNMLENSPFISVISDGSTDTASKEAELVYIRASSKCHVCSILRLTFNFSSNTDPCTFAVPI
ncbi:hypothetical protein CI610_03078 [invertebrate metagenome]|uniref:C17orf113 probable zinc finger domain-containing protein n=1 Tax=invertebrate metagenome TaxID=1711999 RepID=A0A2H9T460_9ZZZZ